MRVFVRTSLAVVGLTAALAPVVGFAQTAAPAGYGQPAGSAMYMGMDGKPLPTAAVASAPASAAKPHKHRGKVLCASCASKQEMSMQGMQVVACAHSKNGVCPACRTLLEMPGTVTVGNPAPNAPAGEAPGHAMVSSGPANQPAMNPAQAQYANQSAVYNPGMMGAEPSPIGVMQTNYAQPGTMAAAPAGPAMMPNSVPTASSMMPGHSMAESGGNPAPFQRKTTSSSNPYIISHIMGWRNVAKEWREQKDDRKTQAHASIPYNTDGTTINELPASVVYGSGGGH